ncbi:chitin binding protein [Paraphaeosphaeria minitans]|uniref:Chitin binding protein n=1 Tax=Paraphaeosphaeria minitans TaxID=565426 RepID=A0A9P6G4K4_9PLEO|nr:chitin binding protein [Paraphaeosphaeria minitans]
MRSIAILASVGAASASAIIPQAIPILARAVPQSYDFNLTALTHSHNRGRVHTLADGQLRLGDGSIPLANFTFTPGIGIVDSQRRGCITTPGPTNQFQCDEGVKPMPDFDFSCDNQLLFKGSPHFWACIVNDEGVRNIYTEPVPQQLWCVYIQLFAWSSPGISNRTGCKEVEHHPDWIFPWDRFYNNTPAVQPDTPEGARQMASYLEDSKQASSNTAAGRPKAEHGIQSPDGRCGSPTGFNCFGKIDGSCCSAHGWCGFSASHCGAGCQGDFGICDEGSSGKASNGTSTSSKVASKASSTDKATTSSTGKTPNSTSSKASSKTFSSNKATSSASRTGKASSSSAPAPSNASATSAPKQVMLSPNGQCGGDEGYHCHGFAAGSCCSSAGWCGSSPSHCGTGCQSGFGSCGKTVSTVTKVSEEKMPSGNATSPTWTPKPLPSQPAEYNGTFSPALDCNDPANAEKCGNSYPAYGCPHDLEGTFESPRLMVTVSKVDPDKALGNIMDGHIGNAHCSLYNFDVSPGNAGQKCSLVWLFPEERYLDNSTLFVTTPNKTPVMEFWHVRQPASDGMTWKDIGPRKIVAAGPVGPGFSCNVKTVPCTAGFQHSFMVCGDNFHIRYAQDSKSPNPMGLFIRTCQGVKVV